MGTQNTGDLLHIVGVGHGVEGPHGERELVQDEEVCVVLCPDQPAQQLLCGGGQVVLVPHLDPGLRQHLHGLGELQPQRRIEKLEGLCWELLGSAGDQRSQPAFKRGEERAERREER